MMPSRNTQAIDYLKAFQKWKEALKALAIGKYIQKWSEDFEVHNMFIGGGTEN
jgi:hypothetical protein